MLFPVDKKLVIIEIDNSFAQKQKNLTKFDIIY